DPRLLVPSSWTSPRRGEGGVRPADLAAPNSSSRWRQSPRTCAALPSYWRGPTSRRWVCCLSGQQRWSCLARVGGRASEPTLDLERATRTAAPTSPQQPPTISPDNYNKIHERTGDRGNCAVLDELASSSLTRSLFSPRGLRQKKYGCVH